MKALLRDYQQQALDAFLATGKGILALYPGAGKTIIGCAAIEALMNKATVENAHRAMGMFWTLVVTPTLDLLNQWEKVLKEQGILNTNEVGLSAHVFQIVLVGIGIEEDKSEKYEHCKINKKYRSPLVC